MLIEVKCIHGNDDSSKCEKCSIQDSNKMLCTHGNSKGAKQGEVMEWKNELLKDAM